MTIVQAAQSRYSTKAFDASRKLPEEKVAAVKELIRMSASSVNSQPWHFIVASSEEGKARIAKATQGGFAFNERKILDASHVVVFCTAPKRRLMKRTYSTFWKAKTKMAALPMSKQKMACTLVVHFSSTCTALT